MIDPSVALTIDVTQVVLEQPDVQRVQHGPQARHRQVELEMAQRVPAEGRDAIAGLDAEVAERAREPARAAHDLRIRRALDPVDSAGDDLAVTEDRLGPFGNVPDEQRVIHHQAVHGRSVAVAQRRFYSRVASSWRIVLGSMKRTSSEMTSSSATSSVPRARK